MLVSFLQNIAEFLDDYFAVCRDESFDKSVAEFVLSETGELSLAALDDAFAIHVCELIEDILHI
jgi:hypothetical protein